MLISMGQPMSDVHCLHVQSMVYVFGILRSWLSFMQRIKMKTLFSGIPILMLQLEYPVDIVKCVTDEG